MITGLRKWRAICNTQEEILLAETVITLPFCVTSAQDALTNLSCSVWFKHNFP